MNAKLVVVKGAKKATIRLRLPTVIGRSPDATVKVPSSLVSRRHCEIYRSGKELVVRDLGSVNGTFVNGERIDEPTLLFEDDLLGVGPVSMHVSPDSEPMGAPATKPAAAGEEPAAKQAAAVKEGPAHEAGASSILSYRETDEGSFVAIAEFDDDLEEGEPVDEDPQEQQAASSAVDALKEVIEDQPPKAKDGDSALDAFFRNLD
jgi:predicted component of type VI protein secretion system